MAGATRNVSSPPGPSFLVMVWNGMVTFKDEHYRESRGFDFGLINFDPISWKFWQTCCSLNWGETVFEVLFGFKIKKWHISKVSPNFFEVFFLKIPQKKLFKIP